MARKFGRTLNAGSRDITTYEMERFLRSNFIGNIADGTTVSAQAVSEGAYAIRADIAGYQVTCDGRVDWWAKVDEAIDSSGSAILKPCFTVPLTSAGVGFRLTIVGGPNAIVATDIVLHIADWAGESWINATNMATLLQAKMRAAIGAGADLTVNFGTSTTGNFTITEAAPGTGTVTIAAPSGVGVVDWKTILFNGAASEVTPWENGFPTPWEGNAIDYYIVAKKGGGITNVVDVLESDIYMPLHGATVVDLPPTITRAMISAEAGTPYWAPIARLTVKRTADATITLVWDHNFRAFGYNIRD